MARLVTAVPGRTKEIKRSVDKFTFLKRSWNNIRRKPAWAINALIGARQWLLPFDLHAIPIGRNSRQPADT
jgi:hypothetical protein